MSDAENSSEDVFDVERIRRLVELMEDHDLREVDLRQSEHRIRLKRGSDPIITGPAMPAMQQHAAPPPAPVAPIPSAAAAPEAASEDEEHITVIKSPMVGTFYARANPNADKFVGIGDSVEPETTVCIIEAMKVFNEIPAETRGKIIAILAEDEEPVDFGRPLFKVDTRA
jgi:acetyl-CoA carboxylase biotin carboxyl carrier protein